MSDLKVYNGGHRKVASSSGLAAAARYVIRTAGIRLGSGLQNDGLTNWQVLRFVAGFWKRRTAWFAIGVTLTVASVGFDLCLPSAASRLIDTIASVDRHDAAAWTAWAFFVLMFAGFTLARNLAHRVWIPVAARNMEELINESFARVQAFPTEWHASNLAGSTVRRLSRAMWGYDEITDALTIRVGPSILLLIGLSIMLLVRDLTAGLIATTVVILFFLSNVAMTIRYVRPSNMRSNALDAHISGTIADAITANAVVKAFSGEARELELISTVTAAWRRAVIITWRRFVDVGITQSVLLLALQAGLTGTMVHAWTRAAATPGDVAFAITAFMLMSGYLRSLGENVRALQKAIDDASAAAAYVGQSSEVNASHCPKALRVTSGEVVFEDITFGYSSGSEPIFRKLRLKISPGETVAIVGASGSGKSTIVKFLHKLYTPQQGRVLVDGQDIALVTFDSLRRAIAIVPQDPVLFHRSIHENIAYGRPSASRKEVVSAAKNACAHEFIERLPEGYETIVGERGVKLSGGERQRIALARALIVDAPILVLDEATSALDPATEERVLAGLVAMRSSQTRIVIAHRPAAIINADRVVRAEGQRLIVVRPSAAA